MHDPPPVSRTDQRLTRRRQARSGAKVEFRRGTMGLGRDLAVSLIDVSEDGLRVRLTAEVKPGEEAELLVSRPGGGKALKTAAEVRWCMPAGDGTFLVGVRFRKRLAYRELTEFVS
jgi:PilZ domain